MSEPGSTPAGYIGRRMMQVISTWYSKNLATEAFREFATGKWMLES